MPTYRVRAEHFPHSILIDAANPAESELQGALFFLIHGLIRDLRGKVTSEAWNKTVEPFEYVPRVFFDDIVPQLEALVSARRAAIKAEAERSFRRWSSS